MAVVYQHIRKDTNEVFYVGIGKREKRAYSLLNRNRYWKNIANKAGYYVEIIYPDLEWKLACNMEQYLIEAYGRIDLRTGCLVNMTNGGDGALGLKHSEETRKKISEKSRNISDNTRKKMSESAKKKIFSEDTRLKLSQKSKGRKHSENVIEKLRIANIGKKHREETKIKIGESKKRLSEEARKNISKSHFSKKEGYVNPNAKKVINIETGEIYNSVTEMCKILGLKRGTMTERLRGRLKNNTNFQYI